MAWPARTIRDGRVLLLLSGETASAFGDAFFNLAVVWVVWSQTQSVLQTAIIQVVWHLSQVTMYCVRSWCFPWL